LHYAFRAHVVYRTTYKGVEVPGSGGEGEPINAGFRVLKTAGHEFTKRILRRRGLFHYLEGDGDIVERKGDKLGNIRAGREMSVGHLLGIVRKAARARLRVLLVGRGEDFVRVTQARLATMELGQKKSGRGAEEGQDKKSTAKAPRCPRKTHAAGCK